MIRFLICLDPDVMMLEVDIVMGIYEGDPDEGLVPILAHPPNKSSDLQFTDFLEEVITATAQDGRKKGVKLDFKDIEAVEPCLKLVQSRLQSESFPITFPVIVNADILGGPVNATKKPLDAARFISLAKQYTPSATLSVGWTTRYGFDDPEAGEIQEMAKYDRQNVKEMAKMIRRHAGDPAIFPHVTFPVRAALAAHSVDDLYVLRSGISSIHTEISFTLWSPATDKVDISLLQSFVQQFTRFHCFIDLPFSIDGEETFKSSAQGLVRSKSHSTHSGSEHHESTHHDSDHYETIHHVTSHPNSEHHSPSRITTRQHLSTRTSEDDPKPSHEPEVFLHHPRDEIHYYGTASQNHVSNLPLLLSVVLIIASALC